MQCTQCGADQPTGNAFCTKCGTRLGASNVPDSESGRGAELVVSPSAKEEEAQILRELKEALKGVDTDRSGEDGSPAEPQWSSGKKLAVAGTLAVVVILVIIGFEVSRRSGAGSPEPPPAPIESVLQPSPDAGSQVDPASRDSIGKVAAILTAIQQYEKARRGLPPALTSLNKSYAATETLRDGWGHNILYLVDVTNKTFVLRSVGPDGKFGTTDDIAVTSEGAQNWVKENEYLIQEWQVANPNLYNQLTSIGPSPEEMKRLEAARKQEQETKQQEAEAESLARRQEQEKKRLESARLEEEKRKQAEARRLEEERLAAKAREEAQRQQQLARRAQSVEDNFINGLALWDAPATWEIVQEKGLSALRVQGLGFLKQGQQWDNYKVEFDVRINKEAAGWVLRAQNSNSFYLFKLGSDKARAIPKNSFVKYIRADDKYLNSLRREDAPGAAGVIPLSAKLRNKDYYHVMVTVRGRTLTHFLDGVQVDAWNDDTFTYGRFGFNASAIEQVTVRDFKLEPLR